MFKNYVKVALRNILRHKGYSFINIAGLAVGIACCILIMLWVQDELSFDRFHKNSDHIYRVYGKNIHTDGISYSSTTSGPIAPGLSNEAPEIKDFARVYHNNILVEYNQKGFSLHGAIVDSSFLNMFSFPLASGNKETALSGVYSILLTEEAGTRIFGDENPIGKNVLADGNIDLTVTGVIAELPNNSSLSFDFLVPIALMENNGYDLGNWADSRFWSFVQLHDNASVIAAGEKIKDFEKTKWPDTESELFLQPLTELHLYDIGGGGQISYVYIFSTIAFIILLIACINFMSLTTARSANRVREIGIRKVVGAKRFQIIFQVMGETILITIIALIIALVVTELLLPSFNNLSNKQLALDLTENATTFWGIIGITLLVGILSGSYPGLLLSSFRSVFVVKGLSAVKNLDNAKIIRKVLVVFQFVLSVFLMIGTVIIYNQLNYVKTRDLGFNADNIVCLYMENLSEDYQAVKNEMRQNPDILNVTATFTPPAWLSISTAGPQWEGMEEDEHFVMALGFADFDYIETFGMEIIEGRPFSEEYSTDNGGAYIVNETAVKAMNMDNPVGKNFSWNSIDGKIIGVVKDFHFRPLRHEIQPFGLLVIPSYNYLCVKIKPDKITGAISFIEDKFKKLRPGQEFSYKFIENIIERRYQTEERMGTIVKYFTYLAIFISCLGLLGLISFTAEQRTKEIGIRKTLGASVLSIVWLLSKESILLVSIASIISWPVAYFVTKSWLENFAYRTSLEWQIFVLAGVAAMIIALLSISYQSLKAALANPVEAIKYE
jgi:putative ABC transport system permease protein